MTDKTWKTLWERPNARTSYNTLEWLKEVRAKGDEMNETLSQIVCMVANTMGSQAVAIIEELHGDRLLEEINKITEKAEKIEAVTNLKKELDARIDVTDRVSKTEPLHEYVKARHELRKTLRDKLQEILGVEE